MKKQNNFVQFTPNTLHHETHTFGVINGEKFDLKGGGVGHPYEGTLNTELKSTHGRVNFQMFILGHVVIMGYPTFSNYQKGGYDLFKISDGYRYTRVFEFEGGGKMKTDHKIKRYPNKVVGEFEVRESNFNAPKLVAMEPLVETFYPKGPGKIESFMKGRWITEDGGIFSANIKSEYFLNHNLELPFPHFRFVKFVCHHTDEICKQDEILVVLHNPETINI